MIETKVLELDNEIWVEMNQWMYPSTPDFCICTNIRQGNSWYSDINNNYYLDGDMVRQLMELCVEYLKNLDKYESKKLLDLVDKS